MKRTTTAVWNEKRNHWRIQVQKDGIRKSFYSSKKGRTGQREANAKADAWLDDNIINIKVKVKDTTLSYIEQLKETSSKSHYTQYAYYVNNWINPKIGNLHIDALTEQHLQSVINAAYSKGLAKKTLQNIRGCMSAWLKFCRMNKYTNIYPENISIPNGAYSKDKQILSPNDVKNVFLCDKIILRNKEVFDFYVYAYRFEILTGLRPGELIGLQWSDINDNIVTLKRAINTHGEITRGKNDNARRSFSLTEYSRNVLIQQKELLNKMNIQSEYVFPNSYGSALREGYYYKRWKRFCRCNNIPDITAYEMRHTFVSITKSLPEGYIKQLVGHSKDMDTYGIYSHEIESDKENAAKMIQDIFNDIIGDSD